MTDLSVALAGVIVAASVSELPLVSFMAVLLSETAEASMTGFLTVTVHIAFFPFDVFTVMVAVPADTAFTLPFDTVATLLLLVVHETVLSYALSGETDAVSVDESPPAVSSRVD